jgi:hypothetical protein
MNILAQNKNFDSHLHCYQNNQILLNITLGSCSDITSKIPSSVIKQ